MRFTDGDLRFLAGVIAGDDQGAAAALIGAWRAEPARLEPVLEDERVLRRLMADPNLIVELSPRLLFSILLRRIRRDLSEVPYTVERIHRDGRVVVFDAAHSLSLLRTPAVFDYLLDLLVSFERVETVVVPSPSGPLRMRRLNTLSIEDMLELAGLIDQPLRPMVFRRIGDIALFTTGLFPDAVVRGQRPALLARLTAPPRQRLRIEDYEEEGRRFYRLAADQLASSHPGLAEVLARLSEDFTAARKPLSVLSERYVAWVRPHWRQAPS
jgi:hypothetical protein